MTTAAPVPRSGPGLRTRVFLAMGLVVLAGAGTLLVVAVLVAPTVFHQHLTDAGVAPDSFVASHVDEGFAAAMLVAIGSGVVAAVAVAAAIAAVVARRLSAPIALAAQAASDLATGDYSARVASPRMGPELDALASSVNALAERLDATEAARRRLVTDLAHELRTPLASIDATVEAIADGVLPADERTLATLTAQSGRLSRLVDDLAAVSRADEHAFAVHTTVVDVREVIEVAVAAMTARYAVAHVLLDVSAERPVWALADPDRLAEVLGQLLDNALRHCGEGDRVTVSAGHDDDQAVVIVRDTGAGFEPRDAESVFERFYRGRARREGDGGRTGVGLTIARHLITAQHGTLSASSDGPGTGATFTIRLPRRPAPHTAAR